VLTLRRGQEVGPVAIASQDTLIWFRKWHIQLSQIEWSMLRQKLNW
jgi:hypothetical protein